MSIMMTAADNQAEQDLQSTDYVATSKELRAIDAAMASIDTGQVATDAEIRAALAKFRSA
jgi:predicted transcriptional regulator